MAFYDIPYRLLQFPVFLLCVATTTTTADEIAKITFQSLFPLFLRGMTVLTKMHFERRNEREHTVSHKKFRVAAYGCLFLGPGWQKNSFMAAVRMKREA